MENYFLLVVLLMFSIAAGAKSKQQCPREWKSYGGSCYLFVLHTHQVRPMTWKDARNNCSRLGGDLVSITSSSEADFIHKQTKRLGLSLWIGLYKKNKTKDPKKGWAWSDGSKLKNPRWKKNEPNNADQNENCVELKARSNEWNDNNCNKRFSSICERKKGLPFPRLTNSSPKKDPPSSCDIGWEAFKTSCYKFEASPSTWNEAKRRCKDSGGHLVKIDSNDEQDFLTLKARALNKRFWMGLNNLEVASEWVWVSAPEERVTITYWQTYQPSNLTKRRCGFINKGDGVGFWHTEHCGRKYSYICEKEGIDIQSRSLCILNHTKA